MKIDGTEGIVLGEDKVRGLAMRGDWIYYVNLSDKVKHGSYEHGTLYKMKTDGTQKTKLSPLGAQNFLVDADWIYYDGIDNTGNNKLWRVKTDGTEHQLLFDRVPYTLNIAGQWLYIDTIESWKDKIFARYVIKTDGSEVLSLDVGEQHYYKNICGEWIYYTKGGPEGGNLYKVRLDGTGRVKLTDDKACWINIVGDWILYEDGYNSRKMYRIKKDGTGRSKLTQGVWQSDC